MRFTGSPLPYDVGLRLELGYNRWGNALTGKGVFSGEHLDLIPADKIGLWCSRDNWNWSMCASYPGSASFRIPSKTMLGPGYYKLSFRGGATFFGVESNIVRVTTPGTRTNIANLKISGKRVAFGKKVTISGFLEKGSGKNWTRVANKPVWLGFTCGNHHPRTGWFLDFGKAKTNARGVFKKTVKASCSGRIFAVRLPAGGVYGSYSNPLLLKVTKTPKGWTTKKLRPGPDLWS